MERKPNFLDRLKSRPYLYHLAMIAITIVGVLLAAHIAMRIGTRHGTHRSVPDFTGLGLPEKELFDFLYNEAFFCCDPGEEYYGAPCMARVCTAVPPHELERSLEAFLEAAEKRGFAR